MSSINYVVTPSGEVLKGKEKESHNEILERSGNKPNDWEDVGEEMRLRVYQDEQKIKVSNTKENLSTKYREQQLEKAKDRFVDEKLDNFKVVDLRGEHIGTLRKNKIVRV